MMFQTAKLVCVESPSRYRPAGGPRCLHSWTDTEEPSLTTVQSQLRLSILSAVLSVECANILCLYPYPMYSHLHTLVPLFKELAARGHNVTVVSSYPQSKPIPNWNDLVINLAEFNKVFGKAVDRVIHSTPYEYYYGVFNSFADFSDVVLHDEVIRSLLRSNDKYDLVITEPYNALEPMVAFVHKFNATVIGTIPFIMSPYSSYMTGHSLSPPDVPNYRTTYTNRMTFLERLDNTVINILELSTALLWYLPKQEEAMAKYMVYPGSENRPPLIDILKDIPLFLYDFHYSLGYVRGLQSNIIPIGGMSVNHDGPLPQDLQIFMDNSTNGVVYVNFGSILKMSSLGKKIIDIIITTFQELNVNVLMKWENDSFKNKPKNMLVRKWFPQSSVLAHPNCRLSVMHGGIHGISEAAYHGVPVVGVPFFADQPYNVMLTQAAGYGYMLSNKDLNKESFMKAVTTVLNDKTYKENAVKRSKVVRDRPQSALETAVFWVEYALRHKDLSHLKPPRAKFPIYQLYSLDVITVLLSSLILIIYIICKLFKIICNACLVSLLVKEKND